MDLFKKGVLLIVFLDLDIDLDFDCIILECEIIFMYFMFKVIVGECVILYLIISLMKI